MRVIILLRSGSYRRRLKPLLFSLVAGCSLTNRSRAGGCAGSNYPFLTSYERDNETGLDYAQARYYASTQGRFTSVDPLRASATTGNPQTFNRYAYALNSPTNVTDSSGMLSINMTSACGQWCQNSDNGPQGVGGAFTVGQRRHKRFHTRDTSGLGMHL